MTVFGYELPWWSPLAAFGLGLVLGAVVFGLLLWRRNGRSERPVARLFSLFLEPLFYWLDLYGPDGKTPSHGKVMYTAACGVSLASVVVFGNQQILEGGGLDGVFVFYALAVLCFVGALDLFKSLVKSRGGAIAERLLGRGREDAELVRARGQYRKDLAEARATEPDRFADDETGDAAPRETSSFRVSGERKFLAEP